MLKGSISTLISVCLIASVYGKARVSDKVIQDFKKGSLASVLVQLTPAELPQLNSNSRAIGEVELETHAEEVFRSVTRHGENTKTNIKQVLDGYKKSGLIKGYRFYSISNTYALEAPKSVIEKLATLDQVEEITPNHKVASVIKGLGEKEAVIAADLEWTGKEIHWSLKHMNATNLPNSVKYEASKLIYANADTGVEFTHPAVVGNYLGRVGNNRFDHNYAWWDANKNPHNVSLPNLLCGIDSQKPCDDNRHGTHTMGTVIGAFNLGVSPTSKWMACKNMDQGLGSPETYLGCLQFFLAPTNLYGINPRPNKRPHVVGNSYGCPGDEGCARSTFKYALRALKSAGIFMSVSAGNDGRSGCSTILSPPALDPNSFTVAASQYQSNARASFSSLGPVVERPDFAIDVIAPGVNITSAVLGGKYAALQGTSMASPHVSGAALLVMAGCPHLQRRVDLVAKVLRDSATRLNPILGCGGDSPTTIPNNEFGFGAVNVAAALKLCKRTFN